jgi:hypothetical protein
MRPLSVSRLGRRVDNRQSIPRPGSRIREVYDSAMSGGEVVMPPNGAYSIVREQLRNYYNVEMVRTGNKHSWRMI